MSGPGDPFANEGRGIREILQSVEDALVDAGFDDFQVATEKGTWHWRCAERAKVEAARMHPRSPRLSAFEAVPHLMGLFPGSDAPEIGRAKQFATCHTSGMTTFTITPRDRSYWVEAITDDGSRISVGRYDTEELALARLRALKQSADASERQNARPPGSRFDGNQALKPAGLP